ncbi:MAG: class I SAM-dependent methyltransferase [Candidatus Brocadiia bacterium]
MGSPPDSPRRGPCPLCGGAEHRRLVTKRGCDVVRCAACGMVFVWPQPPADQLEALYAAPGYHAAIDEAERRRTFARRLGQLEELAPRRGRLLDVGCSTGTFLQVARDEGWDAAGVDLDPQAVEAARARGLDARCGRIEEAGFEPQSFDVVTLFDLVEHTPEPRATLAACRRLLRPGGLLALTTPDIGGLVPRVTYWLSARTLGAWDHPTPPGHLVQFSRRTLRQMLASTGFAVVRWRSEHIPVAYSVGKLENSVMDVLAGRHKAKPQPKPSPGKRLGGEAGRSPAARPELLRRTVRSAVRLVAWAVVGGAGLAARATGWGDSLWLVARAEAGEGTASSRRKTRHRESGVSECP